MTLLSFIHSTERAQWQSFEAYGVKLEPGQRLPEEWLMREKSNNLQKDQREEKTKDRRKRAMEMHGYKN